MSFYLINPGGRLVVVDTLKEFDYWLTQSGFKEASKDQVKKFQKEREAEFRRREMAKLGGDLDIYLSTVTQGGKDGFGVASSKLIQELRRLGVNIDTFNKGQKIAVLFHNPYSIMRIENDFRILYTMFESTKIPEDWKDYLEAADIVVVPSKWCAEVFERCAKIKPKVIPLGYDANTYKFVPRKNKRKQRKDFVFLHYNAFNARKGFLELFKAFNKEFDKTEPVKLVLKTTLKKSPLPITKAEYPNIIIKTGNYNDQQMHDLLYESDAFVFPSRGEGFGMTPLEAMATGLPTIVPNAHGITEYFDDKYMYEVKVKETCPALYSKYKDQDVGEMVVCDVDHLAKQMRYIYEHQDEALEKGKEASEYVKQWTYEQTAIRFKALFESVLVSGLPERPLRNVLELKKVQ